MTRTEMNDLAERLKAHAMAIGLTDDYGAKITWANESTTVYLTIGGLLKIRVGDHGSAYACSISVSPEELSEADAVAWLDAQRADELK